jgi:hypothetical protein
VVEPSAWACWKNILKENFKNTTKTTKKIYLGSLKMELPKKLIFNIFQI